MHKQVFWIAYKSWSFLFLFGLHKLPEMSEEMLNALYMFAFKIKCKLTRTDLHKVIYFSRSCFARFVSLHVLQFTSWNNSSVTSLSAVIDYEMAVAAPTTVASAERPFSKLEVNKIFLWSCICQGLSITSIKNEAAKYLHFGDLINEYVEKQMRKIKITY